MLAWLKFQTGLRTWEQTQLSAVTMSIKCNFLNLPSHGKHGRPAKLGFQKYQIFAENWVEFRPIFPGN